MSDLARTPLHALHLELGARMVPFAGHEMPLNYPEGILAEHRHCRASAALFDVSHMGQVVVTPGSGVVADAALALEALVPADLVGLAEGRQRYCLLTTGEGGIRDDLMVANRGDHLFLVVNAANKAADLAHLQSGMQGGILAALLEDRALLALQGPAAADALARLAPEVAAMRFMDVREATVEGAACVIARSGYTGEDGFEISVPAEAAEGVARALLAGGVVKPAGLGARDTLRLEAGLCLHGNDIDETTSPVEAGLAWTIGRARRPGGPRAGGFPGSARILAELADGPARRRVGLRVEGRAPVREGAPLFESAEAAEPVGHVTSGAFGPSVGAPVAMGYVPARLAAPETALAAELRGRRVGVAVAPLPFVGPNQKRG